MPQPKTKEELHSFVSIMRYMSKFSQAIVEVCEPLRMLTAAMTEWTWSYQELYQKAKLLINKDVCMKVFDTMKPLYLETGASGVCLWAGLLQGKDRMNFTQDETLGNEILRSIALASNILSSVEREVQQNRKRSIRNTTWTREILSVLMCKRSEHNHGSQTISRNFQERHSYHITISMHITQNTSMRNTNTIKTRPRYINRRLATIETHEENKDAEKKS